MKLNYGRALMWAAVIVSMPRWAGAFISADVAAMPAWVDAALNGANIVAGFGMGFLEVMATAYMLEAWGRLRPKARHNQKSINYRWKVLTGFIVGLFLLMPFILAPYVVSRMGGVTVHEALAHSWLRYVWSVAVVLSPAFIVGGVAFAQDGGGIASNKPARRTAPPRQQPVAQPVAKPVAQQRRQHRATNPDELIGTARQVYEIYKRNPRALQREVAAEIGISRQMVSRHKARLNGVLTKGVE